MRKCIPLGHYLGCTNKHDLAWIGQGFSVSLESFSDEDSSEYSSDNKKYREKNGAKHKRAADDANNAKRMQCILKTQKIQID